MLVVGYSDALQAWLVKNSWGTSWGMAGYGWVRYGDSGIDQYSKAALRNVSPDPWTKRRLHNGALYESGNGPLNRNLEVMDPTAAASSIAGATAARPGRGTRPRPSRTMPQPARR